MSMRRAPCFEKRLRREQERHNSLNDSEWLNVGARLSRIALDAGETTCIASEDVGNPRKRPISFNQTGTKSCGGACTALIVDRLPEPIGVLTLLVLALMYFA
jgi:hypothetical protein